MCVIAQSCEKSLRLVLTWFVVSGIECTGVLQHFCNICFVYTYTCTGHVEATAVQHIHHIRSHEWVREILYLQVLQETLCNFFLRPFQYLK